MPVVAAYEFLKEHSLHTLLLPQNKHTPSTSAELLFNLLFCSKLISNAASPDKESLLYTVHCVRLRFKGKV